MGEANFSTYPTFRSLFAGLSVVLLGLTVSGCTPVKQPAQKANDAKSIAVMQSFRGDMTNVPEAAEKEIVILISIDGYRWDYNKKFEPPHLTRLAKEGVSADSLLPVYPSKTFPNHYSLVTGLYPGNHGIVANTFYDPVRDDTYLLPDRTAVEEGSWYNGNPLWLAVQKQGLKSASYFWVGSEADIQGMHPNYYYFYDGSTPNRKRVDQVIEWLGMPPAQRPHFITLYFSEVDSAGHRFGTESDEVRQAVKNVDTAIGRLRNGIDESGLPVNIIVVSDHGMQNLDPKKTIVVDERPEVAKLLTHFKIIGGGTQMMLHLNPGADPNLIGETKKALEADAGHYRVFDKKQMQALNIANVRSGDLILESNPPYAMGLTNEKRKHATGATHGWEASRSKDMHGIFYAHGPSFRKGARIDSFELIHVYPLVMKVLELPIESKIDGNLEPPVTSALKDQHTQKK